MTSNWPCSVLEKRGSSDHHEDAGIMTQLEAAKRGGSPGVLAGRTGLVLLERVDRERT